MKEGWKMVKLGEVAEIIAGQSPEGKFYNEEGIGTPFYQGKKEFTAKYIGLPTTWTTLESKIAIENDILMSVRAPVGDINFATQRICIGRGLAAIRPYNEINKDYLYYYLIAEKKNIKGKEGAVFPSINRNEIKTIKLPLPPLEEQHRIVSILDASFEKIDALKKNAEENLKNAKALFQQVLAQELKPKEGWVEKKLQDVCEIINGYAFPSSAFKKNNEVKVIKITNVGVGKFIKDDENKLPQHYLTNVEDVIINELDIVVALTRTIIAEGLKVAIVPKEYDGALLNQRVAALRMYPKVLLREYLYYYFQTKYAKEYVLSRVNTLMQPNLSIKDLRDMPIPYLPFETQHRIVRTLDTLSEKCRRLEQVAQQTILECDALKQSILRQAFSGEL